MKRRRRRRGGGRRKKEEEGGGEKTTHQVKSTENICKPHPPSKKLLFGAENMTEKSQLDKM